MPFYERQPYITPLYQVLLEVLTGEITVPAFQRPGTQITWTPEQRGDLLDSLYRGFPVGTILLWSTSIEVPSLPHVAGFTLPETSPRAAMRRVLLDGHQRLSTLLAILGEGLLGESAASAVGAVHEDVLGEEWVFETRRVSSALEGSRDQFVVVKRGERRTATQVPLRILFDRPKMNVWIRQRQDALGETGVRLAEAVRDKLREYAMPVAVLVADSLDEATESFKRVNSSGTPMGTFHMVAALAYTTQFSLPEVFEELKAEHLEPLGWGGVADTDILRVCAALSGAVHPAKLAVETVARQLREEAELSRRSIIACGFAANELRALGIQGPESLPYTWQFITLAILLGRRCSDQSLSQQERRGLRAWFWVTTYGGVFGGVNSAIYDRASRALEQMVAGREWTDTEMDRDVGRTVEEINRFDFRAARARAFALLLARIFDKDDVDGAAHRALSMRGAQALEPLRPRQPRSIWSELVIVPTSDALKAYREWLKPSVQLAIPNVTGSVTPSQLGFPSDSVPIDVETCMEVRKRHLIDLERSFVESFGLAWREASALAPSGTAGSPDVATSEVRTRRRK